MKYQIPTKLKPFLEKWFTQRFVHYNVYKSKKLEANAEFQKLKHELMYGDSDGCSDWYEYIFKNEVHYV